jgi:hypothetical protein
MIKKKNKKIEQIRVDFSLRREVVVVDAIVGAVTFVIPKTIFEVEMGLPYSLSCSIWTCNRCIQRSINQQK